MEGRSSGTSAGPLLAVVGGILAVVGSLLAWAEAAVGPASFTAKGIDGWEGKATIVGGTILLVGGIAAFLGSAGAVDRLRSSAVGGGIVAAGVGAYTALTARDQIVDAAVAEISSTFAVAEAEARALLEQALDRGELVLSLQVGIWLVIAGGVVGVFAGLVAIGSRASAPPMPAPRGDGLRGWAAPAQAPGAAGDATPWAVPAPWVPEPPPTTGGSSSVWAPPPARSDPSSTDPSRSSS